MDEDEGRKISDPIDNDYSGLDESWRNTAPDFGRGIADGDDGLSARARRQRRNASATNSARNAEEKASGSSALGLTAERRSMMNGGEDAARTQERSGFYTGSGKSANGSSGSGSSSGKHKMNLRGKMKGKGPFFLVGAIISLAMILVASSQVMAPFALVANALDEFNSLRTSLRLRGNYLSRLQLSRKTNVSLTTGGVFSTEKFKVSKSMQKKLAKNNITYHDEGGTRYLTYDNNITGEHFDIHANELDSKLASSDNFFRDYDTSTRTLRGHFAGWFDSVSELFHKRIVNSRNRFRDTGDEASDAEIQEAAKKTGVDENVRAVDGEASEDEWERKETWKDGDEEKTGFRTGQEGSGDETDIPKGTTDTGVIQNRLTNRAQKVLSAAGKLTQISQMVCAVMKGVGAISAVASALQRANVINYVTTSLESIQKAQMAESGGSVIHYLMNGWSQKGTTTGLDEEGKLTAVDGEKAAMETTAFNHMFGGQPVTADDAVARKYNSEGSFSTMLQMKSWSASDSGVQDNEGLKLGDESAQQYKDVEMNTAQIVGKLTDALNGNRLELYKSCLMWRKSGAWVNMASDVVTLLATGPGVFIKKLISNLLQVAVRVIIMSAISVVISALIPRIAEWLAKDLFTNLAGPDAAYALDSGLNMYLGEQEQSSTGKPGTEAEVIAMHNATQEIIAEEARYDRLTRSPFDITSKNTFLGSIVYSMISIGLSLYTSPTTLISRATSTVGSALNSVLPVVSAADEGVHFRQEINTSCDALSEFGLVGDAYCNPYYVSFYATDSELLDKDPYEIFEKICENNFENGCEMEDGGDTKKENADDDNESTYGYNPVIAEDSEFAKWAVACSARTTPFGQVDQNEYSLFNSGNVVIDTALGAGTGMIPFVGDAMDLAEAAVNEDNIKWSSGEACLSEESKWFSAYSEDQRWMESAGIVEESSVTAYLNKFYEKNPLDNSTEGIIARYSGLTAEQVDETLGLVELYNFVANYDPTGLGPKVDAPTVEEKWQYEGSEIVAEVFPEVKVDYYIIYSDVRNRTMTV